jgi:hypothetical protein
MTDIELAKECLSTYETQGYFPQGGIYSFPKLLSSLITTTESQKEEIEIFLKDNFNLRHQLNSQKEEIERHQDREFNHYPMEILELETRIFKLQDEVESTKVITDLKDRVIKELIKSLHEESKFPEHVDFLVKVAREKARLQNA